VTLFSWWLRHNFKIEDTLLGIIQAYRNISEIFLSCFYMSAFFVEWTEELKKRDRILGRGRSISFHYCIQTD
jgi:hypothetical protein